MEEELKKGSQGQQANNNNNDEDDFESMLDDCTKNLDAKLVVTKSV